MPIVQANPSYFEDDVNPEFYKNYIYHDQNGNHRPSSSSSASYPRARGRRSVLSSEDTETSELEVFLTSSCESNGSVFKGQPPPLKLKETSFTNNHSKENKLLNSKWGQFLFSRKSKSKHSLDTDSQVSTSPSTGPVSPISSSSLNSSTNTNHQEKMRRKRSEPLEEAVEMYRFEDCSSYAANSYYNVGGYYANEIQTFSTFPNHSHNPRRNAAGRNRIQIIEQDDGYLQPKASTSSSNGRNELEYHNVQVDVHGSELEDSTHSQQSTSTLQAPSFCTSGSYIPFYENGGEQDQFHGFRIKNEGKLTGEPLISRNANWNHGQNLGGRTNEDCDQYCSLCGITSTMGPPNLKSRMDVAIVSCQECFFSKNAESHIRSFFDKLVTKDKQKMDVKLQSYDLKDLEHSKVAADVHGSKVQIVVISHPFLHKLKLEAHTRLRLSPVNRVFRSKRVIAVLVGGVNKQEISEGYQMVLARFGEWFCAELKSASKLDPEFSKKFTEQVIKIYNLEQSTASKFSVFPKKVTRDQPKIAIIMKHPIETGDEVRIDFTCGRRTESSNCVRIENPFSLFARVPDSLCPDKIAYVEVTVYVNGHKLGATCIKSDLQGRQGDEDVLEKMTKMVPGFGDLLDEHVKQALIRNYTDCTDFRTDPDLELMNDVLICRGDEIPTILHFSAYYGLEHTAYTILDEADGIEMCKISNEEGLRPLELAENRGQENVAQVIRDYHIHQEISGACVAFQKIKRTKYYRESLLQLSQQGIVSSKTKANEETIIPCYENLPETEIIDVEVSKEEEKLQPPTPNPSSSSGGSYIALEDYQESTSSEEDKKDNLEPPKPMEKPIPIARSPRNVKRKKDYVNVEGENNTSNTQPAAITAPETNGIIDEEVRLREPKDREVRKVVREQVRKISKSPIKIDDNYDIPRLADMEYSIPPPGARPVVSEKPKGSNAATANSSTNGSTNSPVLHKKGQGSIPTSNDGYLIMDHEENSNGEMVMAKEYLRYQEGNFVPVTKDLKRFDSLPDASFSPIQATAAETGSSNEGSPASRKVSQSSEPSVLLDPVDEELIQLMRDFVNSGYTLQQIELLFENWKSRPDVMRSIEDKKSYMKKVREEYKRIQAFQSSKGGSFLEKIKFAFGGKKKTSETTVPRPEQLNFANHKFSFDDALRLQSRTSADRESFGSHESGSGNSVPDSGVSEPESETMIRNSPKPRRVPSYVERNVPLTFEDGSVKTTHPSNNTHPTDYQVPPPPRPVTGPPSPIPAKPPRTPLLVGEISPWNCEVIPPPPVPQKPSHMRSQAPAEDSNSEDPPPPPPRTYIKPNPFNYIDYSSRRGESKPAQRSPSPYDNLKEERK